MLQSNSDISIVNFTLNSPTFFHTIQALNMFSFVSLVYKIHGDLKVGW